MRKLLISAALATATVAAAVPTAAISATPCRRASSTIPAIASTVRAIGSGFRLPSSSSPSPRRATSARSTIVVHSASAERSPTWNFTEFVPTSIVANRRAHVGVTDLRSALVRDIVHMTRNPAVVAA